MEDKLQELIKLNIALEGALRVMQARPSAEASDHARRTFKAMADIFASLEHKMLPHAAEAPQTPDVIAPEAPETDEEALAEDKLAEATAAEEAPMAEPSAAQVPPTPVVESDAEAIRVDAREPNEHHDIRKAFTLNDKFYFIREIFAGNQQEFYDTVDLLGAMHSYDEASEYIFEDLQLDADSEPVAEFMKVIATYFKGLR